MLQSLLAILAGFAVMVALVIFTTALAARFLLGDRDAMLQAKVERKLPVRYLLSNLGGSTVAAGAGGYLTATIAGHDPLLHGGILAAVMVFMSIASIRRSGSTQPVWYQTVLATVMPLVTLAGAALAG